jgi:hypothetical protein
MGPLGQGFLPLGLDEDDPTITAMAAAAIIELDETCKIPDR